MNGIVVGLLPGVLWMVAVIFAVSIITITVSRGHLFTPKRRRPPVDPVDWSMVKTHFMSFAAALIPFPVLTFTADLMDARMLAFYDHAQLPRSNHHIRAGAAGTHRHVSAGTQRFRKPKWTSVWALLLTGIRMMLRSSRFSAARLIRS